MLDLFLINSICYLSAKFNKKYGGKKGDARPRSDRDRQPCARVRSDRDSERQLGNDRDERYRANNSNAEDDYEPPFDKVRGGSRAENEAKEDDRMKTFFRDSQKVIRDIIGSLKFTVYSFLMTKLITICCPEVLRVC